MYSIRQIAFVKPMRRTSMDALGIDFIELISDYSGLLVAGTLLSFNAMTASWGSFGFMWERPFVTVDVKPMHYTSELPDREDYFTLSFFPKKYKDDLMPLVTNSYCSSDKTALTKLTPRTTEHGIVFDEAEVTLICRKIYNKPLDLEKIPDFAIEKYYKDDPPHHVYIGEIIQTRNKSEDSGKDQKLLTASCFGSFEVYANGEPIRFKRTKTKELLRSIPTFSSCSARRVSCLNSCVLISSFSGVSRSLRFGHCFRSSSVPSGSLSTKLIQKRNPRRKNAHNDI